MMSRKDNNIPTYAIRAKLDSAQRSAGERMVCAAAPWLYRLKTLISRFPVAITSVERSKKQFTIEMARDANRRPIRRTRELRVNQLVAHQDAHNIETIHETLPGNSGTIRGILWTGMAPAKLNKEQHWFIHEHSYHQPHMSPTFAALKSPSHHPENHSSSPPRSCKASNPNFG